MKHVDRQGEAVETVLDVASVGTDVAAIASWDANTSFLTKVVDVLALVADVGAAALPGVPGVAGLTVAAVRAGDKAHDVANVADAASDAARAAPEAASTLKTATTTSPGVTPAPGTRTVDGYIKSVTDKAGGEVTIARPSQREILRVSGEPGHGVTRGAHVHPTVSNSLPDGTRRVQPSKRAREATKKDAAELHRAVAEGNARTKGGKKVVP